MCEPAYITLSFTSTIYFVSLANPIQMRDDKSNWQTVWKCMKDSSVDSSDDMNIFDRIVKINAKERGKLFQSFNLHSSHTHIRQCAKLTGYR